MELELGRDVGVAEGACGLGVGDRFDDGFRTRGEILGGHRHGHQSENGESHRRRASGTNFRW